MTKALSNFRCVECGYIYDPADGDPDNEIDPGTPFEDLPPEWVCPGCSSGLDMFESLD